MARKDLRLRFVAGIEPQVIVGSVRSIMSPGALKRPPMGAFDRPLTPRSILFAPSPNVFPLWDLWQKECDANTQMGGMVKAPLCGRM